MRTRGEVARPALFGLHVGGLELVFVAPAAAGFLWAALFLCLARGSTRAIQF